MPKFTDNDQINTPQGGNTLQNLLAPAYPFTQVMTPSYPYTIYALYRVLGYHEESIEHTSVEGRQSAICGHSRLDSYRYVKFVGSFIVPPVRSECWRDTS